MQNNLPILIVGGGIGGLTAALALLHYGIDVEVLEQAPALREVGAGVQISANGSRVLYRLGVGDTLAERSCEAAGKEIRLWSTGQSWPLFDLGAESLARYGYPYFTVYRPDLLQVLAEAVEHLKPGCIRLGSRVVDFAQRGEIVSLQLADGQQVEGRALVGADGIHSAIRNALFGAGVAQFTGLIAWRGLIPMGCLPAHMARMVGVNWVGPGRHVIQYPVRRGSLMNFVGIVESGGWQVESWTARGTPEALAADFDGWHADVQAMVRAIAEPYRWALLARPPLARWSEGRVTLLGDACHPTLPMLAQGAVQAIEDGFVLARAVAAHGDNIATAFARYESARRERTTRVVQGSAENARRFHNPELANAGGAAAYVAREWAEDRIRARYDWLFEYRADEVPV